jgi:hypothetical protein
MSDVEPGAFALTTSGLPSPLKSPTATPSGVLPATEYAAAVPKLVEAEAGEATPKKTIATTPANAVLRAPGIS